MIHQEINQKITVWLNEHRAALIEQWMELCRIPSVRGAAEPGAPFGKGSADALAASAKLFEAYGFETRLENESGYAISSYGEGEKTIGIFAHSDVVPVGDDWTVTQPFEPKLIDGVLYGRGSGDNKSGIIEALCALAIIRDLKIPFKSRLWAVVGSAEESGMEDLYAFTEKEPMPELSISPDAAFPCAVGEKGIYRAWVRSGEKLTAVKNFFGGEAMNVVLGKATVLLQNTPALKAELQKKIADNEAFTLTDEGDLLRLLVLGRSAHAAAAGRGVSATFLAAELLADCKALPRTDRTVLQAAAERLCSPYAEGMGLAHEDPVFGKLTAANGMVKMEDGHLCISFDFRYGIALPPKELEERFEKSWKAAGWGIEDGVNRPGFNNDPESPFPAIFTETYNALTGKERQPVRLSGGTYCRCLKNAFSVGDRAFDPDSTVTAPELPEGHGGAHQPDEYVIVDQVFHAARILVHSLLACDEELNHE